MDTVYPRTGEQGGLPVENLESSKKRKEQVFLSNREDLLFILIHSRLPGCLRSAAQKVLPGAAEPVFCRVSLLLFWVVI